jgi:hypothetical protein
MKNTDLCDRYSVKDYDLYVSKQMPEAEAERFEEHCWNCSACLQGISKSQERYDQQLEKVEDEYLFRKTLEFMDQLEGRNKENLMDIIVRTSKHILELISTTGELLSTPDLVPVRGGADFSEEGVTLRVIKELADPPFSLQASLRHSRTGTGIELTLSLFDRVSDEFCSDVAVALSGPATEFSQLTDENGTVTFALESPGDYIANLESNGEKVGSISITMNEGQ